MAELNAPISTVSPSHCAPAAHSYAAFARLAAPGGFPDHARIEQMLLEGAPAADEKIIAPDDGRPGNGLVFKSGDTEAYAI